MSRLKGMGQLFEQKNFYRPPHADVSVRPGGDIVMSRLHRTFCGPCTPDFVAPFA